MLFMLFMLFYIFLLYFKFINPQLYRLKHNKTQQIIKPYPNTMQVNRSFQSKSQMSKTNTQIPLSKAILQLQAFTNNLQQKVDGILKAQQTQFVNSYKIHMLNIKRDFNLLSLELKKKQDKIKYYENQGKLAYFVKRVDFLEKEQKKLLADLQKKKIDYKDLLLQMEITKSENRRLQQKIKDLLRAKAQNQQKIEEDRNASYQSIPTFTTQIGQQLIKKDLSKIMTQQKSLKMSSLYRKSQRSQLSINPQIHNDTNRLQRQISTLKKQNRQLLSFNSKFLSQNTQMQRFLIETINQIKKNITVRKQIKQCTLQQFRKQDKLQLLIKILSNDQIIYKLYTSIFNKNNYPALIEQDQKFLLERQKDKHNYVRNKLSLQRSSDYRFPSIKSARLY